MDTRHLSKSAYREKFKEDTLLRTTAYKSVCKDSGSTSKLPLEAKCEKMSTDKLKDIKARIKELKPIDNTNSKTVSEISAFTIAVDLVSGTMVGVIGGVLTDKFFHSKPLFLMLFTVLGMIAGFNIIRKKLNNKKQEDGS